MIYSIGVVFLCAIAVGTRLNRRSLLVMTFLFLTVIAILFEPQEGLDLYNHYNTLDQMRQIGYLETVAQNHYTMGNLPVYSIFFFVISLVKYNKLLLIVTYYIVYGCMFHVLTMCVEDNWWEEKSWRLGYTIIMLIINAYVITGIRYMLAFSVVFMFLYIDLVRKEHRILSFIAYFLMCLLHDGMILIVFLRFLLWLPMTKTIGKLKYLVVFWQGLLYLMTSALRMIPHPFFISVADKLALYSTQESAAMWVGGIGMRTLSVMRIIILIVLAVYFFCSSRDRKDEYTRMLFLLILFCLGGMSSAALIDRYTSVTFLFSLPFIMRLNDESNCYVEESNSIRIQLRLLPLIGLDIIYFICLIAFQYRYFI